MGPTNFDWTGMSSTIVQMDCAMKSDCLRRRRTGRLPIRGISREWAKLIFSVSSVTLW